MLPGEKYPTCSREHFAILSLVIARSLTTASDRIACASGLGSPPACWRWRRAPAPPLRRGTALAEVAVETGLVTLQVSSVDPLSAKSSSQADAYRCALSASSCSTIFDAPFRTESDGDHMIRARD